MTELRPANFMPGGRRHPERRSPRGRPVAPATGGGGWRSSFTTERQGIALLVVAVLVGGGGSHAGIANLLVQLSAFAVLALSPERLWASCRNSARPLVWLAAATIALPLVQLIPLPQSIWSALPGRGPVSDTFALIGLRDHWFPLSMSPSRTFIAFLALLPALVMLLVAAGLDEKGRTRMLWAIVWLGMLNVAVGAIQLATGSAAANFYGQDHEASHLYGTFANHNATGLFLDIALLALIGLPQKAADRSLLDLPLVRAGIGMLLVLGVVLTQSRSSIAILAVPFAILGLRFMKARRARPHFAFTPRHWGVVALAVGALLAGAYLTASSGRFQQVQERFSVLQDERPHIWADALTAAGHYWPVGAGIGAFDDVFQLHESLEYLTPLRAGRAHNDYLEFAIEAGVAGFILVVAWLAWLVHAGLGRRSDLPPAVRSAALAMFVAIGLQGLIDYPMRTQALLCIAGAMVGLLGHRRPEPAGER